MGAVHNLDVPTPRVPMAFRRKPPRTAQRKESHHATDSVCTRQAPATNLSGSFALLLDWFSHAAHQLPRRPTEFGTEVIAPITYW